MKYTIKSGDTLESISIKYLGSDAGSRTLWTINKFRLKSNKPSVLYPGEIIEIPDQWPGVSILTDNTANKDELYVYVNEKRYSGWINVKVKKAIDELCGSFDIQLYDVWSKDSQPIGIIRGDAVKVTIGKDVVINGYVDSTEIGHSADSLSIQVSGRDRTCDLVDCSVLNRPGEFRNKNIVNIAKELCAPYNIDVECDVPHGTNFDVFRIEPGEKVFESLEKMARAKNMLVTVSKTGNVLLTQSGSDKVQSPIVDGVNLIEIKLKADDSDRYSTYIIEGQNDTNKVSFRGESTDDTIKRHRPLIITAEDKADAGYVGDRAKWEAKSRAANAQEISCSVAGWRNELGDLWEVNHLVYVYSWFERLDDDYLISEVEFSRDDDKGYVTSLTLKRKDAFSSESELKETHDILTAKKQVAAAAKKAKHKKRKPRKKSLSLVEQIDKIGE